MGFFTEFFVRPRPKHETAYRNALALLAAMSPADRAEVDEIVARLREKGHGMRSIIHEVVQSRAFRQE